MPTDFLENWEVQARKGLLELCVLNVIARERLYGYDIVRALTDAGSLQTGEGTVYPLLARLRREGMIDATLEESDRGPARKYYHLTPHGTAALRRMNRLWDDIAAGVGGTRRGAGR